MNNRQKKKLAKRLEQKSAASTNSPVFCEVKASAIQLESIGCPENIHGIKAECIKDYPTGYSMIKVENKEISEAIGEPFFNFYDIPKNWLKFV